jgi:hypothetical protein
MQRNKSSRTYQNTPYLVASAGISAHKTNPGHELSSCSVIMSISQKNLSRSCCEQLASQWNGFYLVASARASSSFMKIEASQPCFQ